MGAAKLRQLFRDPATERRLNRRLRVARLIGLVPCNRLRILLHRVINKYQISSSAVLGFGVVLAVDRATIGRAMIGKGSRFDGPCSLVIEDDVLIGAKNTFSSIHDEPGDMEKVERDAPPMNSCIIRRNAWINGDHYVDTTGGFELGENSLIAGRGSQFWTHGLKGGSVVIGSYCYVSSHVIFTPRSAAGNHTLVAPGSVVTKRFNVENVTLAGVPARITRAQGDSEIASDDG